MADPYFKPHTLYADFQNAYKSVMSRCNLVLNDCPQQSGVAFGLQVQQTAPNNQLNRSILNGENVHNPFNHSRFKEVPVRVIYHQEPEQTEPLDLSVKPKAQQTDESAQFHTGQLKLSIDQVWSMAGEASSQLHSNRAPLTSTLNGTAGNSSLGVGQSTPQSSFVVDSNLHHSGEISNQGRIDTVSHPYEKVQDPEKRKLRNQRERERRADPEKRKLINQRERERRADPEKRKLINQRQRERRADPEKRELINQRQRERRADPEKRKLRNQRKRERYHEKMQDPEKRKLRNQRKRERYHEKMQDPEKRKLRNQRERERRADPEKRKLINQRERERLADPEKRKLKNQRQRERLADPEKRKLRNQRQRERYHEKVQDPEKRKLINQRQQALPAINPSGDISQLSYITEATPTSSTN